MSFKQITKDIIKRFADGEDLTDADMRIIEIDKRLFVLKAILQNTHQNNYNIFLEDAEKMLDKIENRLRYFRSMDVEELSKNNNYEKMATTQRDYNSLYGFIMAANAIVNFMVSHLMKVSDKLVDLEEEKDRCFESAKWWREAFLQASETEIEIHEILLRHKSRQNAD